MMRKNDILEAEILSLGCEGEGVAKPEGFPVFIPGALPGERCRVQVLKVAKSHAYGKLLEVLSPSDGREVPLCPVFGKCGGCQLQHMSENMQLAWKRERVKEALYRIGGIDAEVAPVYTDGEKSGYRNKIQVPFSMGEGGPVAGFFAPHSHNVIPCTACRLQTEKTRKIIEAVLLWAKESGASVYRESTHTGLLRHLYVREGDEDSCMVSLVTRTAALPQKESLISRMQSLGVTTLLHNINAEKTNVILGKKTKILYGSGGVFKTLGDFRFFVSHDAFFQVNALMALALYEKGLSLLGDLQDKTVFDLYSGIGSISLFLEKKAKKVVGVEIVEAAVRDAAENARRNGIENAFFYAGDAFSVTDRLLKNGERADVCVIDPPRKGCSAELLETLFHMQPEKILYISCNPATLARDIKIMTQNGYTPGTVFPFDLFPQTAHVETVVLLQRQNT